MVWNWLHRSGNVKYHCPYTVIWTDIKTMKRLTVEEGYPSDGATHARDVKSVSWFLHDRATDNPHKTKPELTRCWDDGTPMHTEDASRVLSNCLRTEGRWLRSITWYYATKWFGPQF